MIDIEHLGKLGISSEAYKPLFECRFQEMPESRQKLVRWLASLITDSRRQNLTEWRSHAAVDAAFRTPFAQTTPTIIQSILDRRLDRDGTMAALAGWGLKEEELFLKVPVKDAEGRERVQAILNPPVAVQILLPIVRAYVSIRLAKLFNDRNTSPFLQYQPLRSSHRSQVACEIITDVVNQLSTWYGYPAVFRQGLQQMLKYGYAIAFPLEEWHQEKQFIDGEDVTVKEGLRYHWPHPTRMNVDTVYPWTAINTDTGPEWGLHWRVMAYGEILDSEIYWNRESIFQGTNWFAFPNVGSFFEEVYPCQFQKLVGPYARTMEEYATLREDQAYWYTTNNRNRAVFTTEVFAKISPKTWGLGDYRHKVWHRFTIAGDDTVIFATPCAYPPMWFMGYDWDDAAANNASLALECIPWQDEVGNILNQIIEHSKENLATILFYNQLAVNKTDIDQVTYAGNRMYRNRLFIGYDPKKMAAAKINMGEVFTKVDLGGKPIVELLQTLPIVLQMMERLLQISAQEAGSAGPHQQSKEEVTQTAGASTNRVRYTGSFVDEGIAAWMRQLHAAVMAYMDPEVEAEISEDIPDAEKILADLGFQQSGAGDGSIVVTGPKHALRLEQFADTGKVADSARDKETAQIIFQTVGTISGQEFLRQQIGAKKLLDLIEMAARLAGAPRDFRLRVDPNAEGDDIPEAVKKAIEQANQALEQKIAQSLAQPIAKEMAQEQQEITQLQQMVKSMDQIVQAYKANQDKNAVRQKEAEQRMAIKDAEFQQEQRRKDEAHQADLARKSQETQAGIAADAHRTQADITHAAAKTQNDMAIAAAKAASQPQGSSE